MSDPGVLAVAAARVRELAAGWRPPAFDHVPDPDCALFLCAVDHKTGYAGAHRVDGRGPFAGSELMWELGMRTHHAQGGDLLRARALEAVTSEQVAGWFEVEGETVADSGRRAGLWRDLAGGVARDYGGEAHAMLDACGGRLGGADGLVARLSSYEAYSDQLAKKAFLFAKICERRGWLEVTDPESWEVSADNVLMRLALRSGLVEPGPLEAVRPATRVALKHLAAAAGMSPPVLDDLLWELGRDDPDLLGTAAGDLAQPPRDPDSAWY